MNYRFSWWYTVLTINLTPDTIPIVIYLPFTILATLVFLISGDDDLSDWQRIKNVVAIYLSMIIHEGSHMAVAIITGIGISELGFGGLFAYVMPIDLSNHLAVIVMVLAGPLSNYVLYKLTSGVLSEWNKRLWEGNMSPVPPLDGFRVLEHIGYVIGIGSWGGTIVIIYLLTRYICKRIDIWDDIVSKVKEEIDSIVGC